MPGEHCESLVSRLAYVDRHRVVNIAIKVSLSLVSAILLEYRHQYCRYFLKPVSLAVSPIHFEPKSRYSSAILINGESAQRTLLQRALTQRSGTEHQLNSQPTAQKLVTTQLQLVRLIGKTSKLLCWQPDVNRLPRELGVTLTENCPRT